MKMLMKMMNKSVFAICAGTMAAIGLGMPVAGQQAPGAQTFERRVPPPELVMPELVMQFERARTPLESRVTTGAPYAADAITESVQLLSDGNRISKKSVVKVYRDSEGRTRREQLADNGADLLGIDISDPVGESMYFLDPRSKTAFRNGVIVATGRGFAMANTAPGGRGTVTAAKTADGRVMVSSTDLDAGRGSAAGGSSAMTIDTREAGEPAVAAGGRTGGGVPSGGTVMRVEGAVTPAAGTTWIGGPGNTTKEDLGSQVIEGVVANGTRSTTTIDAGAIGNAQPIRIVSEQWFSPDLKVLVMTKHSDPRTGDTTYRLTNVTQTEPAHVLF